MLVSRDGFAPYREAISQASRNIIEVVDRFHILKNLSDFFEKIFHTLLPGSFGLEVKECTPKIVLTDNDEYYDRWDYLSWRRILDVKKGYENGESVTSIARRFSISRQTVYNDIQRTGTMYTPEILTERLAGFDRIRQHDQESGGRNTQRA